jgi:hypothetical protein
MRTLGVACALLLALPPAWCCWTPLFAPAAPQEPAPAPCCVKGKTPEAPVAPPLPARCPCADRQTIVAAGPHKGVVNSPLPIASVVPVAEVPRAGPFADAAPISRPLSRPLHLLRCVWLC